MPETILRLQGVKARTTLSKGSIYRLMQLGQFPRQHRLSARAVGWRKTDIDNWIAGRFENSHKTETEMVEQNQ